MKRQDIMRGILLTLLFISRSTAFHSNVEEHSADMFQHFWNVAEALHKIQTRSFRTVALDELIEAGLKAMVNKVDAHSSFFTPQSYQTTLDMASGQFPGVGVSIVGKSTDEESLLIVDVIKGGPADCAQIQSGDKIIEIDGKKLRGLTSDEVVAQLKGPIDTTVTLKIVRDTKPLEMVVTRKIIKDRNVSSYFFPQHCVTYLKISSFSEKTPALVAEYVTKAQQKKSKALILDLRKNPGGLLESAVKTSSIFLPDHSLVVHTKNNAGAIMRTYHTTGTPLHDLHMPLFILTDNFTASSAEVLTGCLQHYSEQNQGLRIFVVGMQTFGKGSVQEVMPLGYGCALKLTTMLYFLPNDACLQAVGITPHFFVKPKTVPKQELRWVEELYGKESSLHNHITQEEVLGQPRPKGNDRPHKPKSEKKNISAAEIEVNIQKALSSDHMVHTCLTLSNAYHTAQTYCPEHIATHEKACAYLRSQVLCDEPPIIEPIS